MVYPREVCPARNRREFVLRWFLACVQYRTKNLACNNKMNLFHIASTWPHCTGGLESADCLGLDLLETLLFWFDSEPKDDKDLHDQ